MLLPGFSHPPAGCIVQRPLRPLSGFYQQPWWSTLVLAPPPPFCVLQFGTTSGHSVSHPFLWATLSLVGQHSSSSFFSTNFKLLIFDCQMFKMAMLRLSSCHKTGTIRYNQTRALLDTEARQPPVKSGCWGVCCVNFWMRNGRRGALCSLPGAGTLILCNC